MSFLECSIIEPICLHFDQENTKICNKHVGLNDENPLTEIVDSPIK